MKLRLIDENRNEIRNHLLSQWKGEGEEWFTVEMGKWGWLWRGSWKWGGGEFHQFIQPNDGVEVTIMVIGENLRFKWKEIVEGENEEGE